MFPASALPQGVQVLESTRVRLGPATPLQTALLAAGLVLVLWVAYRIGKVILRLVAGLLFLGLMVFGIWYLFLK